MPDLREGTQQKPAGEVARGCGRNCSLKPQEQNSPFNSKGPTGPAGSWDSDRLLAPVGSPAPSLTMLDTEAPISRQPARPGG